MPKWAVIAIALAVVIAYALVSDVGRTPSGSVQDNFGENWSR